jgi:heat shock protein HtpX
MGQAYGLYSHIQANRTRSIILMVGLLVLVYLLTFAFALVAAAGLSDGLPFDVIFRDAGQLWWEMLPYATVVTVVWVVIGYFFHQRMIDMSTGAKGVTREQEPKLYNLLENLCISRGVATPALQIMETDALNAYASGMHEKQYKIAVTRGLMNALDDDEMEAVLAHELSHIRNGDVRLMVVAIVIAGVITMVGEIVFRSLGYVRLDRGGSSGRSSGGGKNKGGAILAILLAVAIIFVAWFLSLVIRFALSRSREYLADAGSVELTKNPDALIRALRKIEGKSEMPRVPSGIMEMCIENKHDSIADMFSTHPTVDARVAKLTGLMGGREGAPTTPRS